MNTNTSPSFAQNRLERRLAGAGLIALGVYLNIPYVTLGVIFDYPAILRRPAGEVLTQFAAGGPALILVWYAFVLAALALVPLAVFAGPASGPGGQRALGRFAVAAGVLAGVFQALGLARWVFVVPQLAGTYLDPATTSAGREAALVVFEAMHRFAGVAIGEHLGQLATAAWAAALAVGWHRAGLAGRVESALGLGAAALIILGLAEGFGTVLPVDLGGFGVATMLGYLALSAWMVVAGLRLLREPLRVSSRVRIVSVPSRERPAESAPSSV